MWFSKQRMCPVASFCDKSLLWTNAKLLHYWIRSHSTCVSQNAMEFCSPCYYALYQECVIFYSSFDAIAKQKKKKKKKHTLTFIEMYSDPHFIISKHSPNNSLQLTSATVNVRSVWVTTGKQVVSLDFLNATSSAPFVKEDARPREVRDLWLLAGD